MAKAADYGLGPKTFPTGWFIVAESSELDKGPMAIRFFGRDLALYRGNQVTQWFWMHTASTWVPI